MPEEVPDGELPQRYPLLQPPTSLAVTRLWRTAVMTAPSRIHHAFPIRAWGVPQAPVSRYRKEQMRCQFRARSSQVRPLTVFAPW